MLPSVLAEIKTKPQQPEGFHIGIYESLRSAGRYLTESVELVLRRFCIRRRPPANLMPASPQLEPRQRS